MARVDCPKCGESVKVRPGAERLRCLECGKSFRAPEEDEDEEVEEEPRPRPKRRKPAKKGGGAKVALIAGGSVLGLMFVATLVIILVRGGGNGSGTDAPTDPAKVTVENFKRVKPGMEPREVEALLGGSRSSSAEDMRDTLRRNLDGIEGQIQAGFETAFAEQSAGSEWRKWEGKRVRVWVAYGQTKEGKRAAFSTALEDTGNKYVNHTGFMTWAGNTDLDQLASLRKSEETVRNDPKWVRGAQARALVVGEWRDASADGMVFEQNGTFKELNVFAFAQKDKVLTYRIESDTHLETTKPSPFAPPPGAPPPPVQITFKPIVQRYEYFVSAEELGLIEATPNSHHAALALRSYYRMPVKANGTAYQNLITPLLNDVRGTDRLKQQIALDKLQRFGTGVAVALLELRTLAQRNTDQQTRFAFDAAINAISGGRQ